MLLNSYQQCLLDIVQPFPLKEEFNPTIDHLSHCEKIANEHDIWLLLYGRLNSYNSVISPSGGIEHFLQTRKSRYLSQIGRSLHKTQLQEEIMSLFAGRNIPAVVIKGRRLAADIYHDADSRSSNDIDILIQLSDLTIVDDILSRSGLVKIDATPLSFLKYRLHHATYWHKEKHISIEIHWNFSIPEFFDLTPEVIWSATFIGKETVQLTPEMTIIMLLMHHHLHAFKRFRNLLDIFWAMYEYDRQIDWKSLMMQLRQIGLIKITCIAMLQIDHLWGGKARHINGFKMLSDNLLSHRLARPATQFIIPKNLYQYDNTLRIRDKVILRITLDSISRLFYSFTKTVFPSTQSVKILFGSSKTPILFNYIKYYKWRLKLNKNI